MLKYLLKRFYHHFDVIQYCEHDAAALDQQKNVFESVIRHLVIYDPENYKILFVSKEDKYTFLRSIGECTEESFKQTFQRSVDGHAGPVVDAAHQQRLFQLATALGPVSVNDASVAAAGQVELGDPAPASDAGLASAEGVALDVSAPVNGVGIDAATGEEVELSTMDSTPVNGADGDGNQPVASLHS